MKPTRASAAFAMSDDANKVAKLRCILDVSRQLAAKNDLDDLLSDIVKAACQVLDCERATIFLYDAESHELYARVATGVDAIRFPADAGIAGVAATQRNIINVPDAYADKRFNREVDRKTGFKTRNLLALPLVNLEGELIGVMQCLNKIAGPFDADDEDLAAVLGAQAGVALHRGKLLEAYAERQRVARDLEIARSIQQANIPRESPVIPGYRISGWNQSADETGGDCFDFVTLDDGRVVVLLADATGHGISAALIIAQYRSLVRALLSVTTDLSEVMQRVNRILSEDLRDDRFVTAFLGILDPHQHELQYIAAGQGPLLFLDGDHAESVAATGIPLSIIPEFDYTITRRPLPPGGVCALLTDGFFEAANPAGELFGDQRVIDAIQRERGNPGADLIAPLYWQLCRWTDNAPQADDLTAVIIRRSE